MKVYIGLNDIKPDGMGTAAMSLIRALKLQGYDVQTVHPWKDVTVEAFYEFNPIFLTDSVEPVMPDVCLRQMVEVINNDPECKIFTHFGSPNWGAVVPYLRGDIKTIVSCHSSTPSAVKLAVANKQRTDAYVAVGAQVAELMAKSLGRQESAKLSLIPNAVDISSIPQKSAYDIQDNVCRVLFLGRIEDVSKGCDKIPPIAAELKRRGLQFQWDLVGYFHMGFEPKYHALVRKYDVADVLNVKGPFSLQKIRNMLHNYDIMVLPSNYEGLSLSLLEGMAAGLPCVASKVPSFASVFQTGDEASGLMADKHDINAFAENIYQLASNTCQREVLGKKAHHRVESCYSLEAFGKSYSRVIEQVLNNGVEYTPLPIPAHFVMPDSLKPHLIARLLPTWLKKIIKKYV